MCVGSHLFTNTVETLLYIVVDVVYQIDLVNWKDAGRLVTNLIH